MKSIKKNYYCIFEATEMIFSHLKETNGTLGFEVPDTLFYKGGFPDCWYYTENERLKASASFKDIDTNHISSKCIKANSKMSIVAGVFFVQEDVQISKAERIKGGKIPELTHSKQILYILS